MNAFSPENIEKAIQRVPSSSSRQLKALLERARSQKIEKLVHAIEDELKLRGSFDLDANAAQRHVEWSESVANLDLAETIRAAFQKLPMNEDELALTREIARTPGIGYQALTELRGKGDVGLILGHMIYERLGFFRRFLDGSKRISDLLFHRADDGGRVTYRLTSEAERAFKDLRLI